MRRLDVQSWSPTPSGPIPWVLRVDRTTVQVAPDDMTALLLTLDQAVVVRLAHALMVARIDEQRPVSAVRSAMVHDRCLGHDLELDTPLAQRLARQLHVARVLPGLEAVPATVCGSRTWNLRFVCQ